MVKRTQPWLGTFVEIGVAGLETSPAHQAIDAAFAEISTVHRRMSFHRAESDVSILNRDAVGRPVQVHPYTFDVLQSALKISAASGGCFDVSVGAELAGIGFLPWSATAQPAFQGAWRDIELCPNQRVTFHKPMCIDLGGIAKGFAVDCAIERLLQWAPDSAIVNAGGDLRVLGSRMERVALELEVPCDFIPIIELTDASLASSSGHQDRRWHNSQIHGCHIDGRNRAPISTDRFVCVVAQQCILADALTKVVMAEGDRSASLLQQLNASAYLHDPAAGWRQLGDLAVSR